MDLWTPTRCTYFCLLFFALTFVSLSLSCRLCLTLSFPFLIHFVRLIRRLNHSSAQQTTQNRFHSFPPLVASYLCVRFLAWFPPIARLLAIVRQSLEPNIKKTMTRGRETGKWQFNVRAYVPRSSHRKFLLQSFFLFFYNLFLAKNKRKVCVSCTIPISSCNLYIFKLRIN